MEELLKPKEAASIAKVSLATIYRWKAAGLIETVKFGRLWRVRRSELEKGTARGQGVSHAANPNH